MLFLFSILSLQSDGIFSFLGFNTPGPEFRGNSRERGRRSLTRHAQGSDPPLGAHTSPRRSGKADHGSRACPAPRLVPRRAAGGRLGGGATSAGFRRGLAGGFSAALRGKTAGLAARAALRRGKLAGFERKSRTRWALPGSRGVRGHRVSGPNRGFFRRAGRQTGGSRAQKGAFGRAKGRWRRAWGRKSPLFAPNEAGGWGFGGRNWRRKLAACVGFSGS